MGCALSRRPIARLVGAEELKTTVKAPIGRGHGYELTGALQWHRRGNARHDWKRDHAALGIQIGVLRRVRKEARRVATDAGVRWFGIAGIDGGAWNRRGAARRARHRKKDRKGEQSAHQPSVHRSRQQRSEATQTNPLPTSTTSRAWSSVLSRFGTHATQGSFPRRVFVLSAGCFAAASRDAFAIATASPGTQRLEHPVSRSRSRLKGLGCRRSSARFHPPRGSLACNGMLLGSPPEHLRGTLSRPS